MKVSQVWDLSVPPLCLTIYFLMVSGQGGSKPSSTKCPWMVSPLHRTFSRLKRRINARISWWMVGRPPFHRDFQHHHWRKACSCQWSTVLGFISSAADFHPVHTLARNCCLLGRNRYWGDSVSELFGFGLEAFDL